MNLDTRITDTAIRYGPFFAPLPTAYLIADRMVVNLHWPLAIALITGVAVEVVGLASVGIAMMLRTYQGDRKDKDPDAPVFIGLVLVGCYTATVLVLALVTDLVRQTWPVAIVLPLLSLSAFVALALHHDHAKRLEIVASLRADEAVEKEARRLRRAERRQEKRQAATMAHHNAPSSVTISNWRSYVASLNGELASLTFDDALDEMVKRGIDATNKSQRDKVRRWWRDTLNDCTQAMV